jgi:hypothetical protein
MQHEKQPHQGKQHDWVEKYGRYHDMAPSHRWWKGLFYRVFVLIELSARWRYTTLRQQLALYHTYYNFCLPHASLRQPLPEPKPTKGNGSAKQ